MAEIKSSLELAMEKTKKLSISKKEKEEIKKKEPLQKANSLFHRSAEGHLPLNEVLREIERMDEKTGLTVKAMLLIQWIDAISLNGENERLLEMIESLKSQNIDEAKQKISHLISQYRREKEQAKKKLRAQQIERLKREGIYGSAVDPNIEKSRDWIELLQVIDQPFREKIEAVKGILRKL